MKSVSEVNAVLWDFGTFISLAETMASQMKDVCVYTPLEKEFLSIDDCVKGTGLEKVERVDEPLDPDFLTDIDLFVFPDLHFSGVQRLLVSLGKSVWGSRRAGNLELYRTTFLKTVESVGLDVVPYEVIRGVTALAEYLKGTENKWVKVNRYREQMETWKHRDYAHSQLMLQRLATHFGPFKDRIVFVVQDDIECDAEIGYDGWCVDGEFPVESFQGYEKKNELYLGSCLRYEDLPDGVRAVNEAMSPILKEHQYRNFWATEIRKCGDKFYFIDPTARMPGQTGEQLLNTCSNLPDVIWQGANGKLIEPEFSSLFAAEATLHYKDYETGEFKSFSIPESVRPFVKPYHYCKLDGMYHFPPHRNDEVGVVIGQGDTIKESIENLQEHLEALKDEPVFANTEGFAELLQSVEEAEKQGMEFTDQEIPDPAIVLETQ